MMLKNMGLVAICVLALTTEASSQVQGFTTVELQWAICEPSALDFLIKSDFEVANEVDTWISYYDTADLRLTKQGISAKVQNKKQGVFSKLKLSFASENEVDWDLVNRLGAKCEIDRYGHRLLNRCAVTSPSVLNNSPWSDEQMKFLKRHQPSAQLSDLREWGPLRDRSMKMKKLKGFSSIELSELETGATRLIELSVRADADEQQKIHDKIEAYLSSRQITLCEDQLSLFERLVAQSPATQTARRQR